MYGPVGAANSIVDHATKISGGSCMVPYTVTIAPYENLYSPEKDTGKSTEK